MLTLVSVLLIFSAVGGLATTALALGRLTSSPEHKAQFAERKRVQITRGVWTLAISLISLTLLISGFAGPFEVLIGASMVLALGYALALVDLHALIKR
jgi:hypothetical protein